MTDRGATPAATLLRACEIGTAEGLRFVYAGNIPGRRGALGEHALPGLRRDAHRAARLPRASRNRLADGACPKCAPRDPGALGLAVAGDDPHARNSAPGRLNPLRYPLVYLVQPPTGRRRAHERELDPGRGRASLLRRAGFGGTPAEIDALYARGLEGAVSSSSTTRRSTSTPTRPSLAARGYNLQRLSGLQQWFLDRMAFSPRPLEEKMTYFWNLHWTSGIAKVRGETLLLNQNQTERQSRWPGSTTSSSRSRRTRRCSSGSTTPRTASDGPTRTTPASSWSSSVSGSATTREEDVREVARALTGWTVANYNRDTGYNAATFVDRPQFHDDGLEDDPRARPATSTGTTRSTSSSTIPTRRAPSPGASSGSKLWAFFAGDVCAAARRRRARSRSTPSRITRSARSSARSCSHPEFYEAHTRKTWVRSPVEYAVASVRMLEGTSDFSAAANALAGDGPGPLQPADAKGWDWGTSWMNTGSLFARASLANTLVDESRRDAGRGSTRPRSSRAATSRRPRASSTRSPRGSTSTTSRPRSGTPGSTT